MDIHELYTICEDRPNHTNELHLPNDFYGHAAILKRYAQFPPEYQIKATIEHGIFFGGFIWEVDMNAPLPAMIVPGTFRELILKENSRKTVYSIGPILAYSPHYLSEQSLRCEKRRLGKNLLAFPYHSTHWLKSTYNIKNYCKALEKIGKDFDSIRICLYWKDVLQGLAEKYMSYGFECVTAGHMYDPMFLPRLKSIIETSSVTSSQGVGTQLGYCVLMNKPHFIIEQSYKYICQSKNVPKVVREQRTFANNCINMPDILELISAFSEIRDDISINQRDLVEKYWGISQFKSVSEIGKIFEATEQEYNISSKKLIIFGTGKRGLDTFNELKQLQLNSNIEVKAFMDNNEAKWGQPFCKAKVLKPTVDEIEKVDAIIIASSWEQEIKEQLLGMGVPLKKMISSGDLSNL